MDTLKEQLVGLYATNHDYFVMARDANRELTDERRDIVGRIQPGDRVLDVGCGTAEIGSHISKFAHYQGVDISPIAVGMAQDYATGSFQVRQADAEQLPFEDGSFDAVISTHSLEHFLNLERVFEEMTRVLKPGGRLMLIASCYDRFYRLPPSLEYLNFASHGLFTIHRAWRYFRIRVFGKWYFEAVRKPMVLFAEYQPDRDAVCLVTTAEVLNYFRAKGFAIDFVRQRTLEWQGNPLKYLLKGVLWHFVKYWQTGFMVVARKPASR